jgi:uncharacterized protein YifN (PemK superfamily)
MFNQPLPYHPRPGEVLRCNYSGLNPPEMCKVRWVVVLSPKFVNRDDLCTVIPLSLSVPQRPASYHVKLDKDPYPKGKPNVEVWAKCDMLMTVCYQRLSCWYQGRAYGKRNYVQLYVSDEELKRIRRGVLHALGMG